MRQSLSPRTTFPREDIASRRPRAQGDATGADAHLRRFLLFILPVVCTSVEVFRLAMCAEQLRLGSNLCGRFVLMRIESCPAARGARWGSRSPEAQITTAESRLEDLATQ